MDTTHAQEMSKFLVQLQKQAREAFIPKQMLEGEPSPSRIYQLWLDAARSMMMGSPSYGPSGGVVCFSNGPSSWAMLATRMKVFDDTMQQLEGVPPGCGYTDGSVLHVPLSTLTQAVRTGDYRTFLGLLDEGVWVHAHAALGLHAPELEKWKCVASPVDEKVRDSMLYALTRSQPQGGMWKGLCKHASAHHPGHPPKGAGLGLLRIAALVSSDEAKQKEQAPPHELGDWYMGRFIEEGVSIRELGISVNMVRLLYAGAHSSNLNAPNTWKDRFLMGALSRSGESQTLKLVISGALYQSGTSSFVPLFGGDLADQMRVLQAQSILMHHHGDQAPNRQALANAIVDIQKSGYASPTIKGQWPAFMADFKRLVRDLNLDESRVCALANIDPMLALECAVKRGPKMHGQTALCTSLVRGLEVNRMGLSDDERLEVIKNYLEAGEGRLYGSIASRARMESAGLHALMLRQPTPWTQEVSRMVLEKDPCSCLGLLKAAYGTDELEMAFNVMFSAGLRPDTILKWNKDGLEQTASLSALLSRAGLNDVLDETYARFNSRQISQATAQVQTLTRKHIARL